MQLPDFRNVDIDETELTSFDVITGAVPRIEMRLSAVMRGFRWKRRLLPLVRQLFFPGPLECEISLSFLDIGEMSGSLAAAGVQGMADALFCHGDPAVSDLRFIEAASGRGYAFFEFEHGTLQFDFADCIQRERGSTDN